MKKIRRTSWWLYFDRWVMEFHLKEWALPIHVVWDKWEVRVGILCVSVTIIRAACFRGN